jgi:thiol:disulfide interchange protein
MSRSSRWYKHGVATLLSFMMLPEASFHASPAIPGKPVAEPAAASAPQNGLADDYDPRRDPGKDLAAAREEAKRSGKNIFVEVGGEWCLWCHTLARFFHEHPGVETLQELHFHESEHESGESQPRVFISLSLHSRVSTYLDFGRRGEPDSLSTD